MLLLILRKWGEVLFYLNQLTLPLSPFTPMLTTSVVQLVTNIIGPTPVNKMEPSVRIVDDGSEDCQPPEGWLRDSPLAKLAQRLGGLG